MDRRVQRTRLAIREAFFALLLEKRGERITVAEIARTANIDRKTFYLHYDSVTDIFDEFSSEKVRELRANLEAEGFFREPFNPRGILTAMNRLLMEDLPFYQQLARQVDTFGFWEKVQDILVTTIVDVYRDLALVTPQQLELNAHYFAAGILTVYLRWLKGDVGMTIDELAEYAGQMAAYGLLQLFPEKELR